VDVASLARFVAEVLKAKRAVRLIKALSGWDDGVVELAHGQ